MKLKIVTPEGIVFHNENIESVTTNTAEGVITIKEDHVPLITKAAAGMITVTDTAGDENYLAISSGVIEIKKDSFVNILADTADRAEDIDLEKAEEARKAAEEFMKKQDVLENVEFAKFQAQLDREMARIEVGRKYRRLKA